MTFKRVNDFATDNPPKLDRELSQLETNISDELILMRRELAPQALVVSFAALPGRGITPILPDQQLSVDSSAADGAVVFPPLDPKNFGRKFIVIKQTLAGNVATSCQDPAVKCNATTFPLLAAAAVGVFVFYCDASGYFFK